MVEYRWLLGALYLQQLVAGADARAVLHRAIHAPHRADVLEPAVGEAQQYSERWKVRDLARATALDGSSQACVRAQKRASEDLMGRAHEGRARIYGQSTCTEESANVSRGCARRTASSQRRRDVAAQRRRRRALRGQMSCVRTETMPPPPKSARKSWAA